MIIETERLILRPWREDDAETLFKYASDDRVGPVTGWQPHKSVEESREVLKNILMKEGTFAITVKERGDEPIGSFGIFESDESPTEGELELGYWLGVPFWGNGYVPEAVRAAIKGIFETTDWQRVWCGHFEGNDKSRRVVEKCGFEFYRKHEVYWGPLEKNVVNNAYFITREKFYKTEK